MFTIDWFDSTDPHNRRRSMTLELSSPDGQRGTLYQCEREHPADMWPPQVKLGKGYSRTSAAKLARQNGLVPA